MHKLISVLLTLAVVLGLSLVPMVSVSAGEASGSVNLTCETLPPPIITAINVTPTSIGFGPVYPGICYPGDNITVENIGDLNVSVSASLDRTDTVFDNLELDSTAPPSAWAGISNLPAGATADPITTELCVPSDYIPKGVETATLIFEATSEVELYDLTTSISPEGSGSVEPSSGTYSAGTEVSLEATPAPGWQFVSWSGDTDTIADVDAASTTITMNGDYSIVANFELIPPDTYELTMAVSPVGGGTATDVTGASPYAEGAEVSIKAVAEEGYQFVNWTATAGTFDDAAAEDTTFTMPGQAATVTANFEETVLPLPTWAVGNNWVYNCTYVSGTGVNDTGELNVTVTDTAGGNYTLLADYVPDAHRVDATTGSPLTVKDADVFINKDNMQYVKQHASILAYGLIADDATITWTYTPVPGWPLGVGDTYNFTKHTVDALGIVNKTDTRQGKLLGIEDVTVPAGTFSCLHIVEYDPATPDTYTFEHWFNVTVVKSDVKMIDRETYKGVETRELTSFDVA